MATTSGRSQGEAPPVRYSIDIDRVESVLLADGWHHAVPKTFDIREFEFSRVLDDQAERVEKVHDVGLGFGFNEMDNVTGDIRRIAGPMGAVLAVKYKRRSDDVVREEDAYTRETY